MARTATLKRITRETEIEITLTIDGTGKSDINTGIGFFDHMLTLMAFHGGMDLRIVSQGDLELDDHHTVEDTGILLGQTIKESLGDRAGIYRYGFFLLPMDEVLVRSVVDLSGFTNTVVDVFIQIPKADAGTRVAGLNAAAMALAHAGIPMKEMLTAIAVGKADKTLLVDVDKAEEDFHDGEGATDIPLAITSRTKGIALLQLDGKISSAELSKAIEMGKNACENILKTQTDALKNINSEGCQNE